MMIRRQLPFLFLLLSFMLFAQTRPTQKVTKSFVDDDDNFTSVGNIGFTISNFGVFGDGFVEQAPIDQPSCEFPRGSGVEHIFDGGLWVGAQTPSGPLVTTGAFNSARIGSAGSNNFEFTNTDDPTDLAIERSSFPDNRFFSPQAISHQDFIVEFADTNTIVPGSPIPIPNHQPLGISIRLESYAWNFPFADAFVIMNYTITNTGYGGNRDTLKNVYAGLWADLVVRNVNQLPPQIGAPFYADVGVGFVSHPDTGEMVYAYEPDDGSSYTNTNSYVALTFLGGEGQPGDQLYQQETEYNWWLFSGGNSDWQRSPLDDGARYQRMSESLADNDYAELRSTLPGNYMNLITTGPFEKIDPGESINVVFAVVCAKKSGTRPARFDDGLARQALYENVSWAQRAYHGEDSNRNGVLDFLGTDSSEDVIPNGRLDRYILPTPPAAPRFKAIPGDRKVTLLWDGSAEESIDLISKERDFEGYRIYRSFLAGDISDDGIFEDMQLVREFDRKDNLFYDTGLDDIRMETPIVEFGADPITGEPDTTTFLYRLEIDGLHNGWQYAFAISAFDSGDVELNLGSLESSRLQNVAVVVPGTPPKPTNDTQLKIGVYPNPYRVNALWDGGFERQRKLHFYNLPASCEVRIYTLAGDLVDSFVHEGESYRGEDTEWYQKFSEGNTVFPGGEHAWDLVTQSDQAIATGLYLFTVKDLVTGEVHKGKFVVIK